MFVLHMKWVHNASPSCAHALVIVCLPGSGALGCDCASAGEQAAVFRATVPALWRAVGEDGSRPFRV